MDKKVLLSERSEFQHFPIFWDAQIMLKRSVSTPKARVYGRLFWRTFFGEAKKVLGCRATPDLRTISTSESKLEPQKKPNLLQSGFPNTTNNQERLLPPTTTNSLIQSHTRTQLRTLTINRSNLSLHQISLCIQYFDIGAIPALITQIRQTIGFTDCS